MPPAPARARADRVAPAFRFSTGAVREIDVSVASAAVFGEGTTGAPLALQLVRAAPTRIAVIGQARLASALALRAAAFGADVVVLTERPVPWEVLASAVGDPQLWRLMPADAPPVMTGLDAPLFVVVDHVSGGGETHLSRSPWQTSLHVVRQAEPGLQSLLDAVDVVVVGRPTPHEVAVTLSVLRFPEAMAAALSGLRDDEVVVATRTAARIARVGLTRAERDLVGG